MNIMLKQTETYWYVNLHHTPSHEWSKDVVLFRYEVDKILAKIHKEYPNTPFAVDAGVLVFIRDNDEYSDEIAALYNLLLLKLRRKHDNEWFQRECVNK